jgi:hypothetical protein
MATSSWSNARRLRRHGATLQPADRRALERAGWRTTLEYRENHVRAEDGTLLEAVPAWTAEAERFDGGLAYASAVGTSEDEAWSALRGEIEADRATSTSRIRLLRASAG